MDGPAVNANRIVTTLEEVKALPQETVILETPESNTYVAQKHEDEWYVTSDAAGSYKDEEVELPATVIWTP